MAKAFEVLEMLLPNGGWIINGEEYEGIVFLDCNPITKKEFEDGFAKFDEIKAKLELQQKNEKKLLLEKLGITEEEAKLLLS